MNLCLTCKSLHAAMLPELYRYDKRCCNRYSLWWACVNDRKGTVRTILAMDPTTANIPFDVPVGKMHPLAVACENGSFRVVETLLLHGVDPNVQDEAWIESYGWFPQDGTETPALEHPINWVFHKRSKMASKIKVIKLLVQFDADINKAPEGAIPEEDADSYPIRVAPIFRALGTEVLAWPNLGRHVRKHRPSDVMVHKQLVMLTLLEQFAVFDCVLQCGASPDLRDHKGRTPLLCLLHEFRRYFPSYSYSPSIATLAEESDQREIVENHVLALIDKLLQYGADLHATTATGTTALHLACSLDGWHGGIAKYLIGCGSDVNAVDGSGRTPLYECCEQAAICEPDLLEFFIAKGAKINHQDSEGRTLLHAVCRSRGIGLVKIIEYVELLVSYGAAIDLRDQQGHTAEYYAFLHGDDKTTSYLRGIREQMEMGKSPEKFIKRNRWIPECWGMGLAPTRPAIDARPPCSGPPKHQERLGGGAAGNLDGRESGAATRGRGNNRGHRTEHSGRGRGGRRRGGGEGNNQRNGRNRGNRTGSAQEETNAPTPTTWENQHGSTTQQSNQHSGRRQGRRGRRGRGSSGNGVGRGGGAASEPTPSHPPEPARPTPTPPPRPEPPSGPVLAPAASAPFQSDGGEAEDLIVFSHAESSTSTSEPRRSRRRGRGRGQGARGGPTDGQMEVDG